MNVVTILFLGRESLSPDVIEIGVMSLQKSGGAGSAESSVAFARVKNLEDYISKHVNLQYSLGKTWQHEKFNNEIWIKIGVSMHFNKSI